MIPYTGRLIREITNVSLGFRNTWFYSKVKTKVLFYKSSLLFLEFAHSVKSTFKNNISLVKVNVNLFKTTSIRLSYSSVIREKGESQNGGNKKTNQAKFSYCYPLIPLICTCAHQGVRYNRFSENLTCFIFSLLPFWDSSFSLIADVLSLLILNNMIKSFVGSTDDLQHILSSEPRL